MTKTEIDLYIELQNVFASFKGEWQYRDLILRKADNKIGFILAVYKKALTIQFPDMRGIITIDIRAIEAGGFAWLPLPIDPVNPKRGLWGMIDWDGLSDKFISPDGDYLVFRRRGEELHNIIATPTEALLRALKAQRKKDKSINPCPVCGKHLLDGQDSSEEICTVCEYWKA